MGIMMTIAAHEELVAEKDKLIAELETQWGDAEKRYLDQRDEKEKERVRAEKAEDKVKELEAKIVHCPNCGGDWADTGLTSGCSCSRIRELEEKVDLQKKITEEEAEERMRAQRAEARAKLDTAEVEAERDNSNKLLKWASEAQQKAEAKVKELKAQWCDNGCSGACATGYKCDQYEAMMERRKTKRSS